MVRPDSFDEVEDEWATGHYNYKSGARHVRAPQRRSRDDGGYGHRTTEYLVPEYSSWSTGLHRTKSQGHAPNPNVTIINTTETSPHVHTEQKSPMASPNLPPRGRPRRIADEWALEDEIAELRLEIQKQRSRSRSDAHYHHHGSHSPSHESDRIQLNATNQRLKELEGRLEMNRREEELKKKMELEGRLDFDRREEELRRKLELKYVKEAEERAEQERREELIKRKLELKYLKDRQEREEEEARIKAEEERFKKEWELKHEREERKRIEKEKEEAEKRKAILAEEKAKAEREAEKRRAVIAEEKARMEREERQRELREKEKEEERKRIIMENQMKLEKQAREAREERQRAVDAFNKEQAEKERKAREERERIVAEYEAKKVADAAKAKKQREELIMQLKIEEEQRKQQEKEEYERFLMKQRQKEQDEKEKKEKEEARLEEEMRKRLAQFGFQDNQIKAMIKPEEAAKLSQGQSPAHPLQAPSHQLRLGHPPPTYVKVHKEHLAIDTLIYYDIPYEIDRTNPDYIIIMREMEPRETEILFEHTRRLRSRGSSRLLIEERHDHGGKNEYAWVRRRKPSRSPSRRRSSPKRVVGIKEMFY